MKDSELVLVTTNFKLRGKAKYVFAMLQILATTRLIEDDKDWWAVRAYLMAHDWNTSPQGQLGWQEN